MTKPPSSVRVTPSITGDSGRYPTVNSVDATTRPSRCARATMGPRGSAVRSSSQRASPVGDAVPTLQIRSPP